MHKEPRKWSWTEFIIGWINKKFLVFLTITWLTHSCLNKDHALEVKQLLVIGWILVACIWMLSGSLEQLIENGKLSVEAKLGASIHKGGAEV